MQYCSLQHWTLLLSPVISATGYCFCFGSIPSFFLDLFLHWPPVAYWAPTDLGSTSFSILSFCIFILFMESGLITSWEIDWETVETVSDFILGASKFVFLTSPQGIPTLLIPGSHFENHSLSVSALATHYHLRPFCRPIKWKLCAQALGRQLLGWL